MFIGPGISSLVDYLDRRQASLWHACQLNDLVTYFALGGIPARSLVERRGLVQTAFVTDVVDRVNGVWDKVFLNLDDFGRSFAAGWRAVPNPYGPIVLQARPRALMDADDVAIALRSAGAHDFDRVGESLSTIEEVDRIYRFSIEAGFPRSADTRFGAELQAAFKASPIEAKAAEVSASFTQELISLDHVTMAVVEPLVVADAELVEIVRALAGELGRTIDVKPRRMGDRRQVWSDLVGLLADGVAPLTWFMNRADISPATRAWMLAIRERGLEWQFTRFATYLYEGTLQPILGVSARTASRDGAAVDA